MSGEAEFKVILSPDPAIVPLKGSTTFTLSTTSKRKVYLFIYFNSYRLKLTGLAHCVGQQLKDRVRYAVLEENQSVTFTISDSVRVGRSAHFLEGSLAVRASFTDPCVPQEKVDAENELGATYFNIGIDPETDSYRAQKAHIAEARAPAPPGRMVKVLREVDDRYSEDRVAMKEGLIVKNSEKEKPARPEPASSVKYVNPNVILRPDPPIVPPHGSTKFTLSMAEKRKAYVTLFLDSYRLKVNGIADVKENKEFGRGYCLVLEENQSATFTISDSENEPVDKRCPKSEEGVLIVRYSFLKPWNPAEDYKGYKAAHFNVNVHPETVSYRQLKVCIYKKKKALLERRHMTHADGIDDLTRSDLEWTNSRRIREEREKKRKEAEEEKKGGKKKKKKKSKSKSVEKENKKCVIM
ncbi:unnamed protein product [Caenorhabditis sp. 36 PRJEB53466]|nr:unnamed protein product [Caenorhabditis sp. 36 PRJEB53466]